MATMYGKTVVYRNNKPLAPATAAAVAAFDRAFCKRWGLHLVVNSGLRTPEYQDQLNAAWVAFKAGRGPKASYALRSTDAQAYHVITNPKGGKSVDLGDTGSDAGVATGYNARANWARAEAPKYGLSPRGYTFGEPWHFELIGDPWASVAGGAATPATKENDNTAAAEEEEDDMPKNSGFVWKNGSTQMNVVVNFGSGAFHEYEAKGAYNNPVAASLDVPADYAPISKSHRDRLEDDMRLIRQGK